MPPLLYFQRFRDATNEEYSNNDDEVDERGLNVNDGEKVSVKTYGGLSPHNLLFVVLSLSCYFKFVKQD